MFNNFSQTELVMQAISFGTQAARRLLVAIVEGLYVATLNNLNDLQTLYAWTETLVEAVFLDTTVFSRTENADESYLLELLERIQKLLAKQAKIIEEAASLEGQIDTLCEQGDLFRAKILASGQAEDAFED